MAPPFLLYGATGYVGEAAARRGAVAAGLRPVLGGRECGPASGRLSRAELGLAARAFPLDDAAALDRGVGGVAAVLHCAGPFSRTSRPMADACLRGGPLPGHHRGGRRVRGPGRPGRGGAGGGGDAAAGGRLRRRALRLPGRPPQAAAPLGDPPGPGLPARPRPGCPAGTATTVVENLPRGGLVRRGGVLRGARGLEDADDRLRRGAGQGDHIPWGDVVTAYHSTGIPDIEVYVRCRRACAPADGGDAATSALLLRLAPLRRALIQRARGRGATAWERDREERRARLGEVTDASRAGAVPCRACTGRRRASTGPSGPPSPPCGRVLGRTRAGGVPDAGWRLRARLRAGSRAGVTREDVG